MLASSPVADAQPLRVASCAPALHRPYAPPDAQCWQALLRARCYWLAGERLRRVRILVSIILRRPTSSTSSYHVTHYVSHRDCHLLRRRKSTCHVWRRGRHDPRQGVPLRRSQCFATSTVCQARYSLVLPSDWTEAAVSKVDKGASGIDSKFVSSGRKKQSAFVTTLRNEGSREGSGFKLSDPKVALATVAGSLYLLQDGACTLGAPHPPLTGGPLAAIGAGTVTSSKRGESFVFDLRGPTCGAFEVRTSSDGRLFAIFVLAPAASWDAEAAALVAIRDSFTVY